MFLDVRELEFFSLNIIEYLDFLSRKFVRFLFAFQIKFWLFLIFLELYFLCPTFQSVSIGFQLKGELSNCEIHFRID